MPVITLPDQSQRTFATAVSVYDVAAAIGAGLAKAALAGRVNGKLVDTSYQITEDATLSIITEKDPEGLEVLRHSTAHLLADAVKTLYPEAQVTIGPVIEDGFYYDFAYDRPFTLDDLAAIEKQMQALAAEDKPVAREVLSRTEAIALFKKMGEHYKAEIIESIPEGEVLSLYRQGSFIDLCRGPHVPSTGKIKAFKLLKVAGAYWRGDSSKPMLQRIYGTAWPNQKALDAYLMRIEEAEKRDHRKIGKAQDLFHLQEEAVGMVFWHAKGWAVWQVLEQYLRKKQREWGYEEVRTPQIVNRVLWERSGHWDKFREVMFTTHSEERDFAIKPMNCPCHVQIFNLGLRSYRDLPLRLAEFGCCHRNEPSGALHGLMRVRGFTQDDGHIFCTEEMIQHETAIFIDQLYQTYADFGFDEILIKLATRPEKRLGSDEIWDKAETSLQEALESKGIAWQLNPGEGAFYGPKLEFSLKDSIGRVWQCGTLQVDFSMPGRLGAEYVAEDSGRRVPVMIHRAALGSLERFIGILIEHYAGLFPVWLAPIQAMVMTITDNQADFAKKMTEMLVASGFRVQSDLRNEKIGFKIREHTLQRIPYLLVIGDREVANQQVAVRTREGEDLGSMALETFIGLLQNDLRCLGRTTP